MSVREAIQQIVEAGFAQSKPYRPVKRFDAQFHQRRSDEEEDEWRPEHDEHDEAVQISQHERVVPVEDEGWLEAGIGSSCSYFQNGFRI